jgi:DNA helicase-2/ATP-dependent DNA helicase PcrA
MNIWREIRRQARLRHAELAGVTGTLVPAVDLLQAAETSTAIKRIQRPANDPLLDGADAVYSREHGNIYFSDATDSRSAAFHVAHEYAHHWLDETVARCSGQDLDVATPAEPEMSLVGEPDAYSPKERAEAQANLFAREFLLPRDKLRRVCAQQVFDAEQIAATVGVPLDLVMQQLADALLLPEERAEADTFAEEPSPDDTQRRAIEVQAAPHQVRAGPGTGKTRTLVGRVKWLIERGEDPRLLLVLTFSNFASQDLAVRLRRAVGERATGVWAGTFHAFGLELLRKYGEAIGLPTNVRLIDRAGSLVFLEELLPSLGLNHYLDLAFPMWKLRSVLALISRAKDELVTPERYQELAQAMMDGARSNAEREEAEKALEVAHAYDVYDRSIRARGVVDFGDLIARPVELFEKRPDIRDEVRKDRPHVLVDEYQDMNRASGILLRELVHPGSGPWVVGDVRQSIYRFRGASPINMARFDRDFPGATVTDLGVNYRSGGQIIRTFETFSQNMPGGGVGTLRLAAQRGEGAGQIDFDVASTFEAECEGIARALRTDVERGGRFGRHAVLARSHTTLARLARHLERAGVPCLYFGDFFERPEIRDLLSLFSLVSERTGVGFFRVAQLPQYVVPSVDVDAVSRWRQERGVTMLAALRRHAEIPNVSATGRIALQRIVDDLIAVDYPMSAHRFLLRYLFRRGHHLLRELADNSVPGQQRRLAIYQLLQFAFSFRANPGTDSKRAFLDHVRRLEILDEEKQLRQLPAAASDIDAVRMMTVHAAKGLEFSIVHIPSLTSRHFPVNRPEQDVPPPGLIQPDILMSREAEEESLFFVALSRAQDALHLSRAISYGGGAWAKVKPSPFLTRIETHLPRHVEAPSTWTDEGLREPGGPLLQPPEKRESWPIRALETYASCPRRFYYEEVLELDARETATPFLRFQSALHASLAWLRTTASPADRQAGSVARLAQDWEQLGPRGHAFEGVYRAAAETMLATAVQLMSGPQLPADVSLTLAGGLRVTSRADHVASSSNGILIQRLKAGRLSKDESHKARYAVLQAAIRDQNRGVVVEFEHVSLLTGERRQKTMPPKKLDAELAALEQVFADIQRGRFAAKPDDFKCPRCPYYFICPAHAEVPGS